MNAMAGRANDAIKRNGNALHTDDRNSLPPANFRLKLTAARSPLPGLKPLLPPETNGVTPPADLGQTSNAAAGVPLCPHATGGSLTA